MDLMRKIVTMSHQEYLREESERRYPIDDPEDTEEITMMIDFRDNFMKRYDKVNNRLFRKVKKYKINEYQESIDKYETQERGISPV